MEHQPQQPADDQEKLALLERLSPISIARRAVEYYRHARRQEKVNKVFAELGDLAVHH
ncbi:hypothetical protein HY379_01855 [Candidatus Saccharibacteria bacterium]|nr:hypothetical protein [Candidatus Saccharibacteria bacterium]